VKVGLWATHEAEYMPLLLQQLSKGKVPFEIAQGATWVHGSAWEQRIRWIHEWASQQKGTIMFIDPWDTLFRGDYEVLLDRVESFKGALVWSAENKGWPRDRAMPDLGTSYKWPNDGGMVGPAELIASITDPAKIDFSPNYDPTGVYHPDGNQRWLDQVYVQDLYLSGVGVLDYECRLFQTLVNHTQKAFRRKAFWVENVETGEWPLLFHANGRSKFPKALMDIFEEELYGK